MPLRKAIGKRSNSPWFLEKSIPGKILLRNHPRQIHRICNRIEPLIYWRIKLDTLVGTESLAAFIRTLQTGTKSKEFYATHVKVVLVNDYVFQGFAAEFLPLCKNIVSLSSRPNRASRQEGLDTMRSILKAETFPRLRKLSLMLGQDELPELLDIFHHPLAQNLTHLDLDLTFSIKWNGLKELQHLRYFSLQPAMNMWISTDHSSGGRQLKALIRDTSPHLPKNLECLVIWLSEHMIRTAAFNDAVDTLTGQQPVFADIVSGALNERVVLAAFHKKNAPWNPKLAEYDEIHKFLAKTIVVKDPKFNKRLIWDHDGTEVFLSELHRVLRERKGGSELEGVRDDQ